MKHPIAMLINEITPEECRTILSRASIGRLGCCLNDEPYVIPVYFAYEGDYIYVFSTMGKKIDWMRTNPRVCVEVDEVSSHTQWTSVIVNGRYQELPVPQFRAEHERARKLFEQRHEWWLNALAERRMRVRDEEIEPLFFRIAIESMTGLATVSDQG